MSHMKVFRASLLLLAAALCLAQGARVRGASDDLEAARQAASAADDSAVGLEARREALGKLEEAARLFLNAGERLEAARALNRAGRLQLLLSAPQDALDSHRRALALLEQTPSPEVEVDGLNGLAAAYQVVKDEGRADEALRKSLALSEQSGYERGRAQALLTLSDLQNYHNHAAALQTAQASLALWQAAGDRAGLARAYAQIGLCYMAQSTLDESAQNYRQALQIWQELNNSSEQAGVLINLGFIEYRKGEWQNEISLMTQAEGLLDERAEPEKTGQTASGLAEAFRESGLPEVGINHYRRALDYYRLTQDPHLVWYATWELGRTYHLMGDDRQALTYLRQALDGVAKDGLEAAQTYHRLGEIYIAAGEYADALQYLQSALDIYTRAGNPKEAAQVRALAGQAYQRQGKAERARGYYLSALEAFRTLSDHVNESATLFALGTLELRQNNLGAAEDYLRQSVEVTEGIRRVSTSRDLTAAFSASVHARYEAYVECLMRERAREPARGLDALAFETSELARARSLAEMLLGRGASLAQGLDPELAAREKSLRQSLRVKEDARVTLLGRAYRKEEREALEAELARLNSEYEQVNEAIRARYPAYQQITRPAAWDLRRVQEQVVADDQTMLLEYSLGSERSYLWAVTRDGFKSYELPPRAQVNEAAERVYELLATKPGAETEEELDAATRELSRMVLAPVAAELNKRRVIVVADGALDFIPFQVLPAPSSGEPLVAGCEVVGAPSATILGELRQETAGRPPAANLLAAFGDPVFASNYAQRKEPGGGGRVLAFQAGPAARDIEVLRDELDPSRVEPLFYARRELDNLRDVAAGDASVAEDFDATRARLLGADLTRYSILHFATHGFLDPTRPENSSLVLSTVDRDGRPLDGLVRLQDVYGLRAPVDLVVLSACRTALGKEVRGEGLIGLTRGFMYAGASSVVASLWRVDDEATSELMRLFYTNLLRRGMTPAAALREAQNGIRQQPQWRSPYYWAAFTLQGEYRQPIRRAPATHAPFYTKLSVAVLMLLAPLAGAAWWYRRRRPRLA
ncbi:MAG TPA: CHAT domain-containing protein [Pyrinomonadaceae bacterium]|nr:CHAT domain-containing protein [Pyrinomonadaceae bacterium]